MVHVSGSTSTILGDDGGDGDEDGGVGGGVGGFFLRRDDPEEDAPAEPRFRFGGIDD